MKGRIHKVINELLWATALPLFLSAPASLAISQATNHSAAQTSPSKPSIVKKVTGTITAIDHPRAGTSVTILGTDGMTYQYGVEEGKIVGATAATLKVGDRVSVEFYNLITNSPPIIYGNPIRTVLLPPSHQPPVNSAVQKQLPPAQAVAAEHVKPTEYYGAAFLQGNGKTLYLLFNHSLYKSIEPTADSWDQLSENIQSAATDPQSPGVIYAVRNNNGVIKTLNDGANWIQISNGLPGTPIHWVVVNPANPQEVFAGTDSGLYRTSDAGFSWKATTLTAPVRQVLISPKKSTTIYALTNAGLFVSTDNADNWRRIDTGLPSVLVKQSGRTASHVPPMVEQICLVQGESLLAFTIEKGLFLTSDAGATWADANEGLPPASRFFSSFDGPSGTLVGTQGNIYRSSNGTNWNLVPISQSGIHLGAIAGLYQASQASGLYVVDLSKDESQQRSISYLDPSGRLIGLNYGVLSHSHITVLAHTIINGKDAVLAVTYNDNLVDTSFTGPSKIGQLPGSVVYVSTDGGHVWEPTVFLSCSAIFDNFIPPFAAGPQSSPGELWVYEPLCQAFRRTIDGGKTWSTMNGLNLNYSQDKVSSIAFDPNDKTLLYVVDQGMQDGIFRYKYDPSTNAGQTAPLKFNMRSYVDDVVVTDAASHTLITSRANVSRDGGWTWANKWPALQHACVSGMFREPGARLLYYRDGSIVGYSSYEGVESQPSFSIIRSSNLGDSWETVFHLNGQRLFWVHSDRERAGHLFMEEGARDQSARANVMRLLESTDSGASWRPLYTFNRKIDGTNQDIASTIRDAAEVRSGIGRVLYVGGSIGLWQSADEGRTWQQLGGVR